MRVGYGFGRSESDLRAAGADQVWLDTSKERTRRAAMIQAGLHPGDTLVLLSIRDLGGSAPADKMWRRRIEALGVQIEIAQKQPRPRGRPPLFCPQAPADSKIRETWLDGLQAEAYRLRRCAEIYGGKVSKGQLVNRYGTPSAPKAVRS